MTPTPLTLAITHHGTTVSYDPVLSRWTATQDGKKTSSGQYDKLMEKVASWDQQRGAKGPSTDPAIEGSALLFSVRESGMDSLDRVFAGESLAMTPMHIKTQWSVAQGKAEVLRYRAVASEKRPNDTPAWESRRTGGTWLNPDALEAEDRALWAQAFVGRALASAAPLGCAVLCAQVPRSSAWLSSSGLRPTASRALGSMSGVKAGTAGMDAGCSGDRTGMRQSAQFRSDVPLGMPRQ